MGTWLAIWNHGFVVLAGWFQDFQKKDHLHMPYGFGAWFILCGRGSLGFFDALLLLLLPSDCDFAAWGLGN
jgi:hypothetical protein